VCSSFIFRVSSCSFCSVSLLFDYMCVRLPFFPWSIAGVPSSQALSGFRITAPPSVLVPAVLGALAVWIPNQKSKKTLHKSSVLGGGDINAARRHSRQASSRRGAAHARLCLPLCAPLLQRETRKRQCRPPTSCRIQSSLPMNLRCVCERFSVRPSWALSPCEFAVCIRALIPSPVPAGPTQLGFRLGQSALYVSRATRRLLPDNIPHIATRAFLLLPSPCIIECSDDVLIVFSPQHFLYHPPAPFPDNSITIAAVVIVWAVLFI